MFLLLIFWHVHHVASDSIQQAGLSRADWADDADELAFLDLEVHTLEVDGTVDLLKVVLTYEAPTEVTLHLDGEIWHLVLSNHLDHVCLHVRDVHNLGGVLLVLNSVVHPVHEVREEVVRVKDTVEVVHHDDTEANIEGVSTPGVQAQVQSWERSSNHTVDLANIVSELVNLVVKLKFFSTAVSHALSKQVLPSVKLEHLDVVEDFVQHRVSFLSHLVALLSVWLVELVELGDTINTKASQGSKANKGPTEGHHHGRSDVDVIEKEFRDLSGPMIDDWVDVTLLFESSQDL